MQVDVPADRADELAKVVRVAGDDEILAGRSPDHDGGVDDVGCASTSTGSAGEPSASLGQVLHEAALEQAGQHGLRTASPRLAQHAGWHDWSQASLERSAMQRPYGPVVALGGDERAGVVGDTNDVSSLGDVGPWWLTG